MTTLCAVTQDGKICFGSDRQVSFGEEKMCAHPDYRKFLSFERCAIGIPGSPAFTHLMSKFLGEGADPSFENTESVFDFSCNFFEFIKEFGSFVPEEEAGIFAGSGCEMLIASKASGIFSVHEGREVVWHSQYYCLGSGKDFALGAIPGLLASPKSLSKTVSEALLVASMFDTHTGNDQDIVEF